MTGCTDHDRSNVSQHGQSVRVVKNRGGGVSSEIFRKNYCREKFSSFRVFMKTGDGDVSGRTDGLYRHGLRSGVMNLRTKEVCCNAKEVNRIPTYVLEIKRSYCSSFVLFAKLGWVGLVA